MFGIQIIIKTGWLHGYSPITNFPPKQVKKITASNFSPLCTIQAKYPVLKYQAF